jgi:hypothetical protein
MKAPVDDLINVEDSVIMGQLDLRPQLKNGDSLFIREQYAPQHYSLSIRYYYAYLDAKGKEIISFDNQPHHPHLATYPHHKHHYPKSTHPPVGFSGEFLDALREFVWLFEMRRSAQA